MSGRVTSGGVGLGSVTISDGTRSTATDSNGYYTLSGVPTGSYTLTPSHSTYSFSPASLSVTVSGNLSNQDFTATQLTYTVSGRVTSGGVGLGSVTISDGTRSTPTDANGYYTLSGVPAGSYTLTPSRTGYSFSPTSLSVTVSTSNLTNQNFTATLLTYSMSGRVTSGGAGLGSVTISDGTRSTTTDSSGNYTLSGVPMGSYTLTPSRTGYSFSPASLSVTVNGNLTSQNFTATLLTYSMSGRVTSGGAGLGSVAISDGTRSTTTDSNGYYTLSSVPMGSYTLTPSRSGYSFSPASLSVTVNGNLTSQNFTATLLTYSMSGRVTSGGAGLGSVAISDGTRSTTTDSNGYYTLSSVPMGSYTLTPSRSGYSFSPASLSVTVNGNLTSQNFTATLLTYSMSGRVTSGGAGLGSVAISDGTRSATTDSNGYYTLNSVPMGSYTLTPSRSGYSFSPASLSVTVNGNLTSQNFTATLLTYSVSGRVTSGGAGLGSVSVSDGTRSATTDSSGYYTLSGVPMGSYTLTPSRTGYCFSPATLSVTVNADVPGQSFAATTCAYSVSGRVTSGGVGVAEVTVSDGTRSATTDSNGYYTLSGVPMGSYTLTPSRSGYSFSPTSLSVTVSVNLSNQNFTATLLTYSVSGRVTSGGVGVAEVTVSDGTYSAITDNSGSYTLSNLPAGSYTLTAVKANCSFTPSSLQVTLPPITSGHDFTAVCSTSEATWTMLLYLAGDLNDGKKLLNDFTLVRNRLRQQFRNPSVRIAIQIDGPDSNDTRRYLIEPGTEMTTPQETEIAVDEQAMDDPQALTEFVRWGQTSFPATHYYLAIADHGQGFQGIAWDGTSATDYSAYLTPMEIRKALSAPGVAPIDVLHLDACSMSLLEVAYEVRAQAHLLIASQYISWSYYAYDAYQKLITPTITPAELARGIATHYANRARNDKIPFTISVLDLQRADPTAAAVDALASELKALIDQDQGYVAIIDRVWQESRKLNSDKENYINNEDDEYVDLLDWATRIRSAISSPAIQTKATALITELTGPQPFILKDSALAQSNMLPPRLGGLYIDLTNSFGVSIFYPQRQNTAAFDHYVNDRFFTFSRATHWKDFLLAGVGPLPAPGQTLEPLPGPLVPLEVPYHVFLPMAIR